MSSAFGMICNIPDPVHMVNSSLTGLRLSSGATPGRPSPSDVPFCCPICQMPLRPAETEAHFAQELDYLTKLSTAIGANHGMRGPKLPPLPGHPEAVPTGPYQQGPVPGKAMSPRNPMEVAPRSRWDVSISH